MVFQCVIPIILCFISMGYGNLYLFTLGPGEFQLSGGNLYVDLLCRPAADNAIAFFNALAEFAYDMETQPCLIRFLNFKYMYMIRIHVSILFFSINQGDGNKSFT